MENRENGGTGNNTMSRGCKSKLTNCSKYLFAYRVYECYLLLKCDPLLMRLTLPPSKNIPIKWRDNIGL